MSPELQDPPVATGSVPLHDWGLIQAEGADAAAFLHGQLTQDMLGLRPGQARLAGYCSAKGRLLATFVVWRSGPERLLLACSADLLAPTLQRLSMFVLRAKCRLSDVSAQWLLAGESGALAASPAPGAVQDVDEAAFRIGLPPAIDDTGRPVPRVLRVVPRGEAQVSGPAEAPGSPESPQAPEALAAWQRLEVAAGVPRIVAATVERFVPQMVNLELTGGVNFQKGCYPGQEVVARSQYRGTLKRRMLRLAGPVLLSPGQEVFHSADPGQPAGAVVLAAPRPGGGCEALVELKLGALHGGSLHAGSADGAQLEPMPLPYALPAAEPDSAAG